MQLPITREINRYIVDQTRPSCLEPPSLLHLIALWTSTVGVAAIGCAILAVYFIGYFIPNLFGDSNYIDWASLSFLIPMMLWGIAVITGVMVCIDVVMIEYLPLTSRYRLHFLKVARGYTFTQFIPVLPFLIGLFLFMLLDAYLNTLLYITLTLLTGIAIVITSFIIALLNCLLFRNAAPTNRLIELLPWILINLALLLYFLLFK